MQIIDITDARTARRTASCRENECTGDRPSIPGGRGDAKPAPEALRMGEIRAPRYTSYPTADRFVEAFGPEEHARHLAARALGPCEPLSLYVHVPFCASLCHYCGCNRTITRSRAKAERWLARLLDETALVDAVLGGDRRVSQLHLGGGTPTFLDADQIRRLMAGLRRRFELLATAECSIEIDPRTVDAGKLGLLAAEGFTRMSFGVQDFDADVQRAIGRPQPPALVGGTLAAARAAGVRSVNFDLIYGLPRQSVERFTRTIEQVIDMRPERIALYHYAHLPERFRNQRLVDAAELPDSAEKLALFDVAAERLAAVGYVHIGMDHFALPDDELAVAHRAGRLHRNFQGYSTQPDRDLVAFGPSAISRVGSSYAQNRRGLVDWETAIGAGRLATLRGLELEGDDLLRRALIMSLMCRGRICKSAFELAWLLDFDDAFAAELVALERWERLGFVRLEDDAIVVTEPGRRIALRSIAAEFDRHLRASRERGAFSRVL